MAACDAIYERLSEVSLAPDYDFLASIFEAIGRVLSVSDAMRTPHSAVNSLLKRMRGTSVVVPGRGTEVSSPYFCNCRWSLFGKVCALIRIADQVLFWLHYVSVLLIVICVR